MKLHQTITLLLISLLLLHSCKEADEISGDDVPGYSPILVSAASVQAMSTRAYLPDGMYDNFKVCAVAEKENSSTVVMDGWKVLFKQQDWTYVSDDQSLSYWDPAANDYLFVAGAPFQAVSSISKDNMTLQLANNTTESVMASNPVKVLKDDFGKTVNLRFSYAHCMVSVAFLKESTEDVTVTDITLTPDVAIASKANLTYSYNWSTATPTATSQVNTTEKSADAFLFAGVTIPAHTTDAVPSATHYYCVPDAANTKDWKVSVTCGGEQKTAAFVNNETWESGKNYIYLFSLTEKGVKLVKVISQDDFFDCNDIIPGDEFSNADMTE